MNFRLTAILLALLTAALLGLLAFLFLSPDKVTPDLALDGLAGVKADEIDGIELKRTRPRDETVRFYRDAAGTWAAREPDSARIDQGVVQDLIRDLLNARPTSHPELANDAKSLGLDAPTFEVTLRKGSDRSATLRIGRTTVGGSRAVTFVATGAKPDRPFAVPASALTGLFKDGAKVEGEAWSHAKYLVDFRARSVFSAGGPQATEAKAVKLKHGSSAVAVEKDRTGAWVFAEPAGYGDADPAGDPAGNPDAFTGVRPLLGFLIGLGVAGPADFLESPTKEDEKRFGLDPDDPEVVRIDYTPATGPTEILYLGKAVDDKDKTHPTVRYAKRLGDTAVVKLRTDRYDALKKTAANPGLLRNRDFFPDSDREGIDALDLTTGGSTVSLRKVTKGRVKVWVLLGGAGEPPEANKAKVDDLLLALARPRIISDFPTPPADAFAPASVRGTATVWVNGWDATAKPGDTPKGTPVVLTFGKVEGDYVFVRKTVGGRQTVGRVPALLFPQVVKPRLEFVDPRVPSFAPNTAVRFAFTKGAETHELVHDDKPDDAFPLGKWTWTKPDGRKGAVADAARVQSLLGVAATLSPGQVVAESPSDADLIKYGLDVKAGPRATVSVTLRGDKDAKPIVYEFGSETEDKGYVYARHAGSSVVYTIPRVVYDRFQADELSPPPPPKKTEAAPEPKKGK